MSLLTTVTIRLPITRPTVSYFGNGLIINTDDSIEPVERMTAWLTERQREGYFIIGDEGSIDGDWVLTFHFRFVDKGLAALFKLMFGGR